MNVQICGLREPLEFDGHWLWHPVPANADLDEQPDYLPQRVFDCLAGYIPSDNPRAALRVKAYRSPNMAVEALNHAIADAEDRLRAVRAAISEASQGGGYG